MMEEMKHCPHCIDGGHPKLIRDGAPLDAGDPEQYAVVCAFSEGGCGAAGGYATDPQSAIGLWNMRNGLDATDKEGSRPSCACGAVPITREAIGEAFKEHPELCQNHAKNEDAKLAYQPPRIACGTGRMRCCWRGL